MKIKQIFSLLTAAALLAGCLTGCGGSSAPAGSGTANGGTDAAADLTAPSFSSQADPLQVYDLNALTAASAFPAPDLTDATAIVLSDEGITVDGAPAATDSTAAVYTARDIVYYEAGRDFTYGEGTDADAHTRDEADTHTVLHITRPGVYRLSGTLSAGQVAVDLGEDAEDDPNAVVTLVLDGVDVTCTVAPAVIFYNVYECGSDDADNASKEVDTAAAGANVVIADGSVNTVNGSYVARIYEPGTVELNDAGTAVEDAEKLHKYDGAFYSKMSMNVFGGAENTGVLAINAENEGLDSELHLTVNGGRLHITSGNDGINTNEDEVSVTTVNGGLVEITVTGTTGEGDGIDSNGWLVINGGIVVTSACADSADAGIDSDMGIWLNGGVVAAGGHMLDEIAGGTANYAVFQFSGSWQGSQVYRLADAAGTLAASAIPANAFSVLVLSTPDMAAGDYSLWCGQTQLAHSGSAGGFGGMGGRAQGGTDGPMPDGSAPQRPDGEQPADFDPGQTGGRGQGGENGGPRGDLDGGAAQSGGASTVFTLSAGGSRFGGVSEAAA